jgi:hypothetical protein
LEEVFNKSSVLGEKHIRGPNKMKLFDYRLIFLVLLAFFLVGCAGFGGKSSLAGKEVTVYKSPTCGCCSKWEEHLRKAGFQVTSKVTENMDTARSQLGVPDKMKSCHTAVVDGYVIEGHVPASDIVKLLKDRPEVVGLAAPGMPQKAPGMQPEGEIPVNFKVLSFDQQGNSKVFTAY